MTPAVDIREIEFSPSTSSRQLEAGIRGHVSLTYFGLRLQDLILRETLDHRLTLSFPYRRDRNGRKRFIAFPRDGSSRLKIEVAVVLALKIRPEEAAP